MNLFKRNKIFTSAGSGGGGGGGATIDVVANYAALPAAAGVTGEFRWVSASTGIYLTGLYYSNGVSWEFNPADDITVVADYNALPAAGTVTGQFYWASAAVTHTTLFITFTDYNSGMYYSNGVTWELIPIPYQATQAEVNTGTNSDKYVTPLTLTSATVITNKELLANKDATGGYVGLTLFKINFKNVANTFTSFFTNSNTAARTYTFQDSSDTIIGRATTDTLTNKRNQPRVVTVNAPGATPSINTDNGDIFSFTGLGANITSMTTGLSGTPVEGEKIEIIFVGTLAYTIAFGASFANSALLALPTTTAAGVKLRVGFEREGSTWVIISIA